MSSQLIAAALALASIAGAVPMLEARLDSNYIIDPWSKDTPPGQTAVVASRALAAVMEARGDAPQPSDVAGFEGMIPGCDADPSYVKPKTTGYAINQGVKVPKDGKDDACTTGHNGDHCWTEYYLVEQAVQYTNWRVQGAGIDCATTSVCDSASAGLQQSCSVTGTTSTDGYDIKILEAALSVEFDLGFVKASPSVSGGGTTVTHSSTDTHLTNTCVANTDTTTCHWDDKKCHQLWVADRVMHVWGQVQRVCNGGSGGSQQSTKRDDGKYVRGQADFEFNTPINTLQGCGALCGDANYNAQLPQSGDRHPFPKPAGW